MRRRQLDFPCYNNYMRILPDPPKRLSNLDKHKMDMDDLTEGFFEAATTFQVRGGRYAAVGKFGNRTITVIFTRLGSEALSVVSMRPASKKERRMMR